MAINESSTAREAPAEWVHRLSLRLLLLAAALLVVGVGFLLWNSWDLSLGEPGFDPGAPDARALTIAERALRLALFSGLGPLLLLLAMMLLCSALVVVRRPWDQVQLPPTRGLGLQPELVGVTAAASLLALVQLIAALLGLTVTGPLADVGALGTLATDLAADIATLCLAAIIAAHWWASGVLPSGVLPSNTERL